MRGMVRQMAVIVVALSMSAATGTTPRAEAAQAQAPQPPAPQPPAMPGPAAPAPFAAPVQTFTLAQAVQATLTQNPQILADRQTLEAAQQNVLVAKSGFGPMLTLNGSGAAGTTNTVNTVPLPAETATGSATVSGNLLVFDNGKTKALVETAEASVSSAQAVLRQDEQNLALEAGTQFFTVLSDEGVADVDQQVLNQAQEQLDLTEAQVRAGVAAQADVIQAQATVAQAQVSLLNARATILTAKAALASTMGQNTTAVIEVTSPVPPAPQVTVTADQVLAAALQNRPEIAAANAVVQAAQAALDTAYVNAGPQVSVNVGAGYTPLSSGVGYTNTASYGLTGTIALPLYDSGRGRALVAGAQAGLKSAQASLQSTVLSVRQDAYTAYLTALQAAANVTATAAAKAAADQALAVAQGQYRAGVGTIVNVIVAQTSAAQADVNATTAVYSYESALVTLQHAQGAPIVAAVGGGAQ